MPLPSPAPLLNRDNAVCVLLDAFRSNDLVKALVFLPGVADDFYLVNRDRARLNLRATNLWEGIRALTNATAIRAVFRPPFLLLHTDDDRLEPRVIAPSLQAEPTPGAPAHRLPRLHYCDAAWSAVQPTLRTVLARDIHPEGGASEAGHFDRPSLAGWNLTTLEALQVLSLATRTVVEVRTADVVFRRPRER
jgi:hypothetical protein